MLLMLLGLSGTVCLSGVGLSMYWSKRIVGIADNWRGAFILLLILGGSSASVVLFIIYGVLLTFSYV